MMGTEKMQPTLERPAVEPRSTSFAPPQAGTQQADSARAALGELVNLSASCAQREAEIAQQQEESAQHAAAELARSKSNAELHAKALHADVQQKTQTRTTEIMQKFQGEFDELKTSDAQRRRQTADQFERATSDVQGKIQQAVWLAESVFEGAQNGLRAQSKQAKDLLETQLAALYEMDQQADQRVAEYRQAPPDYLETDQPLPGGMTPESAYQQATTEAQAHLNHFRHLGLPSLFSGITPGLIVPVICAVAVVLGIWLAAGHPTTNRGIQSMAISVNVVIVSIVCGLAFCGLAGWLLYILARSQIRNAYIPLRRSISLARSAAKEIAKQSSQQREESRAKATRKRNHEVESVKRQYAPYLQRAQQQKESAIQAIEADYVRRLEHLDTTRDRQLAEIKAWEKQHTEAIDQKLRAEIERAQQKFNADTQAARKRQDDAYHALRQQWQDGLRSIQAPLAAQAQSNGAGARSPRLDRWDDPAWKTWAPPKDFVSRVRFGELRVDLKQITDQYPRTLELPGTFAVPAALTLPRHASLLIHFDKGGRAAAIQTLQTTMIRLLTSLPAGRVRFTLIDPVGLGQNFAGFMHLADHDEALVGGRIWTESEHIERRLTDLTEHMETVIQKYLRNEFETIDDYNAQAGELAEPYRFLVIADLPVNFSQESVRRLASIASTGARCGVYTLISRDLRQPIPGGAHIDEIESHSINLVQQPDGSFQWNDEVFKRFPLTLDAPPPEDFLTRILDVVGKGAKEAKRVEVPFATIAPPVEKIWSASSSSEMTVPVGRAGATRLQSVKLGRGVAQHALIAGKTGSGKSTLLHALVTNTAMWYSPDEVEFYLVDFKKGVEFKTYASNELPHARAIAVESDREFGLSVLQRIDAELARRGELYRKLGVQDLASYRQAASDKRGDVPRFSIDGKGDVPLFPVLPRTLLIIDEFQEFFSEDDKLAQDAATLIDRLVRQGRAFGIHVLLGSQTIGGTSGLSRSTIGQMAIRIALQTSEADSQLILGDNNSAARLLTRPGEAIYNDAGGLVEGNSPFQVAWLPDEQRDQFLQQVRNKYQHSAGTSAPHEPAIVFEGNAPADITKNRRLMAALASAQPSNQPLKAWFGDPVAIKDPTSVTFRRQAGANVLIIGQQEEPAMALMASAIESIAAQNSSARFIVLDGTPGDSPLAGVLPSVRDALPDGAISLIEYRATENAIADLHAELDRRQSSGGANPPPIFFVVYALQRYRALRKQEESFSFGSSDEEKKPQADKQFAEILRDGPAVGIHTIAWCDTAAALERTLDRAAMREFDNRILFQMSASDSSNLIDAPTGNKLGNNRALLYSEEQGVSEKFRPYALPGARWLEYVKQKLIKA
jgi:ABC-type multidrug transport system fused ATPase/permease subunit